MLEAKISQLVALAYQTYLPDLFTRQGHQVSQTLRTGHLRQ
jgi:hypothetical protein